jgi:hypothetical protein
MQLVMRHAAAGPVARFSTAQLLMIAASCVVRFWSAHAVMRKQQLTKPSISSFAAANMRPGIYSSQTATNAGFCTYIFSKHRLAALFEPSSQ